MASLETGLRTVWSSPYRAGLAAPDHKHLPIAPAFLACCCPVGLSPPGEPVIQRPSFRTSPVCDGDLAPGDTAHYALAALTVIAIVGYHDPGLTVCNC
jgi:hypothetical protein